MNKHISQIWYDIEDIANLYISKPPIPLEIKLWRDVSEKQSVSFYDEVDEFLLEKKKDGVITDYSLSKTEVLDNGLFYAGVVAVAWIEDGVLEQYNFIWNEEVE